MSDEYMNQIANAGACAKVCGCICSLAMCAGYFTFVGYLGKYAYGNPDLPAWYGIEDGAETLKSTAEDFSADALDVTDVHGKFVAWFTWGFWTQLLPILSVITAGLFTLLSAALGQCVMGLGGCGICCGGLFWWIFGMVWRFKQYGQFASGDIAPAGVAEGAEYDAWKQAELEDEDSLYQISSGNFMAVYYLITWICMGVSCGCSLLGMIGACIASMCCK